MAKNNKQKITQIERAIAKVKHPSDKIRYLNELVDLIKYKDVKRGMALSQQALDDARKVQCHEGMAVAFYNLSRFHAVYFAETDRALEYARHALNEYRNNSSLFGEARALILLGGLSIERRDFADGEQYLAQGLNIAEKEGFDSLVGGAYLEYGILRKVHNDFTAATEYFSKALALWSKASNKEGEATVYHNLGVVNDLQGDNEGAMLYFTKSLQLRQELEDKYGVASSLHNIANVYSKSGDYENALVYYRQSLTIKQEIGYLVGEADTLNNIGTIFGEMKNYEMARKYHTMALNIYRELQRNKNIALCLNNISVDEMRLGNLHEALELALESYTLSKEINHVQGVISACLNVATVYKQLHQLTEAMTFAKEGLDLCTSNNRRAQLPSYYIEIASICFLQGEYDEAILRLKSAIELATELDSIQHLLMAWYAITRAYEHNGEYQQALNAMKNHLRYKEQLTNEQSLSRSQLLLSKFEIEQVNAEKSSLECKYHEVERLHMLCSRELQLIGLHLIEKNQFLKQVQAQIQQNMNQYEVCRSCNLKNTVTQIESNLEGNKQWLTFIEKFDRFHDEFIKRLSTEFPGLTQAELKVATLIRVNMENKDIANLLCSSVRTIEWHRRNIRKKLGIDSHENLAVFLSGW